MDARMWGQLGIPAAAIDLLGSDADVVTEVRHQQATKRKRLRRCLRKLHWLRAS